MDEVADSNSTMQARRAKVADPDLLMGLFVSGHAGRDGVGEGQSDIEKYKRVSDEQFDGGFHDRRSLVVLAGLLFMSMTSLKLYRR